MQMSGRIFAWLSRKIFNYPFALFYVTSLHPKTSLEIYCNSEEIDGNDSDCAATELVDIEITPPTTTAANVALTTLERYLISPGADETPTKCSLAKK